MCHGGAALVVVEVYWCWLCRGCTRSAMGPWPGRSCSSARTVPVLQTTSACRTGVVVGPEADGQLVSWPPDLSPRFLGKFPLIGGGGGGRRDALEGKGPQRRSQKQLDRRLEGVAKAVGGG